MTKEPKKYSLIAVDPEIRARLFALRDLHGFKNINQVIEKLLLGVM